MKKNIPYEAFRNELLKISQVEGVSAVSNLPVISFFEDVELAMHSGNQENVTASIFSIDEHAINNLGIEILMGENFSSDAIHEHVNIIINEKALAALGFNSANEALNQQVELHSFDESLREEVIEKKKIIGVVKDFSYQFVFIESGPLIMKYDPSSLTTINVKIAGISSRQGAEIIEKVWNEFDNNRQMEYTTYAYEVHDINSEFF